MTEKKNEEELLQRAMNLCSTREYCTGDIVAKIEQWGENDEVVIRKIIERLTAEKFIDDERYCRAFALDHFRYQKWGKVKISAALRIKRIPSQAIASGLASIENAEYLEVLRIIIDTHRKSIKAKNRYDLKNKLLRHALTKGFESHLVYEAINNLFEE